MPACDYCCDHKTFHPSPEGLFLFRLDDSVEHGQLIDKSRLAGAYVVCLLGISGQDGEGWLVLADGLLTLGIAPLRQLQQGVVSVVLHRGSPASGTSGGVCLSCSHPIDCRKYSVLCYAENAMVLFNPDKAPVGVHAAHTKRSTAHTEIEDNISGIGEGPD